MVRIEQLSDLETAKQVASLLEAENARLHQRLEALVAEVARLKGEDAQAQLQLELTQLKEQLALMQRIRPADDVLRGIAELIGSGHPWTDAEESREARVAASRRGVRGQRADAA